jgi:acyl dehydratase
MDESGGRSLYFEDFLVNKLFTSDFRTISAADVDRFAELTGDINPIHIDEDFARKSIYGQRIVHGLLTLSVVSGLAVEMGIAERTTIAFRSLEWRFKKSVAIGDSIQAEFKVIDRRKLPRREEGLVIFQVRVNNQHGGLVQTGRWSLVIKARGEGIS